MSARLRGIAADTEKIVAAGRYLTPDGREVPIAAAVAAARSGTRILGPAPVPVPPVRPAPVPLLRRSGDPLTGRPGLP